MKRFITSRAGSVMVMAILCSAVFTVVAGGYLSLQVYENKWAQRNYRMNAARAVADAGIEQAIWAVKNADWTGWDTTSDPYLLATTQLVSSTGNVAGEYAVTVANPAGVNPLIESAAYVPSASDPAALEQTVVVGLTQGSGGGGYALFVNQSIAFSGNATIDSYDSTFGSYGGGNRFYNGDVGTNGNTAHIVSLSGNAKIYGDVTLGPGANPATGVVTSGSAAVIGDISANSQPVSVQQVTAPTGLVNQGQLTVNANNTVTISSSRQYSGISVSGNGKVYINGDIELYVTGSISISGNGKVYITNGSTCAMYCDSSISISGNGFINQNNNPHNFSIYGTDSCTSVSISGNGDLYGVVHARNAHCAISGNGDIYGSLVCNTMADSGNGKIHFDESLGNIAGSGSTGVTIDYWQIQ